MAIVLRRKDAQELEDVRSSATAGLPGRQRVCSASRQEEPLSGIVWSGDAIPKINYDDAPLEAQAGRRRRFLSQPPDVPRQEGSLLACLGRLGRGVVGLSSLNGYDAFGERDDRLLRVREEEVRTPSGWSRLTAGSRRGSTITGSRTSRPRTRRSASGSRSSRRPAGGGDLPDRGDDQGLQGPRAVGGRSQDDQQGAGGVGHGEEDRRLGRWSRKPGGARLCHVPALSVRTGRSPREPEQGRHRRGIVSSPKIRAVVFDLDGLMINTRRTCSI